MAKKELSIEDRFKGLLDSASKQDTFHVDAAKVELSEQIYIAMNELGVSEAELSRRLGVSRAYVNKVLKGAANLTIESLVKIGLALGRELKFQFGGRFESPDVLEADIIYVEAKHTDIPKGLGENVFSLESYRVKKRKVSVSSEFTSGNNKDTDASLEIAA
jgi:transcriptional regulator with XRE-family HTH domain